MRDYTFTEHTFVCQRCERTARASAEAIAETRSENDWGNSTDAEVAAGFDFCLSCLSGVDVDGEIVT